MGNLKDIQDITGLTSEAIFNIRSGKKYFRYAINNLCLAFGCSSLEYWIYFFEGKRVDGSIYYKSISRLVLR